MIQGQKQQFTDPQHQIIQSQDTSYHPAQQEDDFLYKCQDIPFYLNNWAYLIMFILPLSIIYEILFYKNLCYLDFKINMVIYNGQQKSNREFKTLFYNQNLQNTPTIIHIT
ncbi:hypothetical protein PPERSA_08296 [Pseudocohnilembus persalinus]|uniref:Transmembrane protein n=1 Tax=Pseudocohnilembus persalinus TaxID=266149 RepID=A0A0V0QPM6_PSEPJ|nr:hypothetical protein PPERSA_08296 [Pseudocohnilembus persalinus]|eukprot:KRX04081.1 hypothetical protein PPERSA_08296 [Pseudocohnilembus persalinus]